MLKFKKLTAIILAAVSVLSLSACGGKKTAADADTNTEAPDDSVTDISDEYVEPELSDEDTDSWYDINDPMDYKNVLSELKGSAAKDLYLSSDIIINTKTRKAFQLNTENAFDYCLDGTKLYYTDKSESFEESYYTDICEFDVATQKCRKVYRYPATINALAVDDGKVYFFAENDGFYCIDGDKEKYFEHKKSIYYPDMRIHDNTIYFIDEKEDASDYQSLMSYSFDKDKLTEVTDKVDSSACIYRIINDKVYYITSRFDEYRKADSVKFGLYAIAECKLDGSGKKIISKYFSNSCAGLYCGETELIYSEYLSEPEQCANCWECPEMDDSQVEDYIADLTTGKASKIEKNKLESYYNLIYTDKGVFGYVTEDDILKIYQIKSDGNVEKVAACKIATDKELKGDKAYYCFENVAYYDDIIAYTLGYYNINKTGFEVYDGKK